MVKKETQREKGEREVWRVKGRRYGEGKVQNKRWKGRPGKYVRGNDIERNWQREKGRRKERRGNDEKNKTVISTFLSRLTSCQSDTTNSEDSRHVWLFTLTTHLRIPPTGLCETLHLRQFSQRVRVQSEAQRFRTLDKSCKTTVSGIFSVYACTRLSLGVTKERKTALLLNKHHNNSATQAESWRSH